MGKKNIVLEAYAEHGVIKRTARKYNIQANQYESGETMPMLWWNYQHILILAR